MRPTPDDAANVDVFLAAVADADGHPPLSEHKITTMSRPWGNVGIWSDQEGLCLIAVAARHGGDGHWAVEAALAPRRRTAADEEQAIQLAAALVAPGEPHTFWVFRSGQVGAARRVGYVEVRAVLRMSGPMPDVAGGSVPGVSINPMKETDIEGIVEVNNEAFVNHREQGSLTEEAFRSLMKLDWFQPAGVLVARSGDRIAGFCVTKSEEAGIGEVYLLAVAPESAASGIGRALVSRGLVLLADQGAATARAWVDETNSSALRLYQSMGLVEDLRNREMIPATGG